MGRMLTTGEVAAWLRVSRDRLYDLVHAGVLPAVQLVPGGRLRFDADEVNRAVQAGRINPREPAATTT